MSNKVFLYQINVTRDCNLRCTHCYISSEVKKASGFMAVHQFLKIVQGIADHMKSISYDHAEIHVIGGEPTLLGFSFFSAVMEKSRSILKEAGVSFEFIMVSNVLTDEIHLIAPLFDRINTSWEPVSRFPKPKLEEKWRNNVLKLQESGLDIGVTTAMTKPVLEMGPEAILEHHISHGLKQIHFGFFIPSGDGLKYRDEMFPEFHETSDFLIRAAEWYFSIRDERPDVFVNPVESMLSSIHSGEPLDDIVCPIIAGSMDIDWNGNAATCLEAGGNRDAKWLGNVLSSSVSEVASSAEFMREVMRARRPKKECQTCDEYLVCRSGCGVIFEYWKPEEDEDCPGFKKFIKHMRKRHAEGILPKYAAYRGKHAR